MSICRCREGKRFGERERSLTKRRLLPTGQFLFTLETDVAEDWNDNPNMHILSPADASTINPALLNLGASQSQQPQ